MKVILTADVGGLGAKGDIVDVSAGYGRNYLLPNSLAITASAGALKQAEGMRRAKVEAERKVLDSAQATQSQLTGTRVVLAAQASDEGNLFGSIGVSEIIDAVKQITGIELERPSVVMAGPLKSIGLHEVNVRLHKDVAFPLPVEIIPAT